MILNPSDLVADNLSPNSAESKTQPGSDYLLVCEASSQSLSQGTWQFTLEQADGTPVFSADDTDIGDLNRLTLLAAIRGLESIDGPSRVTLLSNNRYLIRSLSDSLPRWRQTDFVWEHFGRRIEVQHAGLWRRIDHALSIHRVEAVLISSRLVSRGVQNADGVQRSDRVSGHQAKQLRIDSPHSSLNGPRSNRRPENEDRLRQWLIGSAGADHEQTVRERLTASALAPSA